MLGSGCSSAGAGGSEIMNDVDDTSEQQSQTGLVDDAKIEKVVSNAMMETRSLAEGDKGEEIVGNGEHKTEYSNDGQQCNGCSVMVGNQIGVEKLIERGSERFRTELTLFA